MPNYVIRPLGEELIPYNHDQYRLKAMGELCRKKADVINELYVKIHNKIMMEEEMGQMEDRIKAMECEIEELQDYLSMVKEDLDKWEV